MQKYANLPGLAFALGAYLIWGLFPFYWIQLGHVSPVEILAHRIIWTLPFVALILHLSNNWQSVRAALGDCRQMALLSFTACLIAINWGVFIWAVTEGRILEASLGYYLTPLVSVFLGVFALGEKLRWAQWLAVGLAGVAVMNLLWVEGVIPWAGLGVAFSFGLYGALRKRTSIESAPGLFIEAMVLMPFALAWLLWLVFQGRGVLLNLTLTTDLLLIGGGVMTSVPLLFYVAAAKRIRLATLGLLFYLTPTLQLLLGTLVYDEALSGPQSVTFILIWAGLLLYVVEGRLYERRKPVPVPVSASGL